MKAGQRLYTIYSLIDERRGDSWLVKVETVMHNGLFQESIQRFWTFDAAYYFVKAKQEEVL